jgi:hypothetical protein
MMSCVEEGGMRTLSASADLVSTYPAAVTESGFELLGDRVRRRLSSPFECVPAACLTIKLRPSHHDHAYRITSAIARAAGATIPSILLPDELSVPDPSLRQP